MNFYVLNFIDWYLSLCGTLVASLTVLLSFLNLLVEIAESFSFTIVIFFIVLPQITLLSLLQDLTIFEYSKNNLILLLQMHTLRVYYSKLSN